MENQSEQPTIAVTEPDSNSTSSAPSGPLEDTSTNGPPVEPTHSSDPRRRVTVIDPRHEEQEEEDEDPNVLIDRALGIRPTTPQRESVIRDISKLKQQSKVRALRKRFSLLSHAVEGADPKIIELHAQIAKFEQITRDRDERTRKQVGKLHSQNSPGPSSPPPSHLSPRPSAKAATRSPSEQTATVRKHPRGVQIADAPHSAKPVAPGNSDLDNSATNNKRNSGKFANRQKGVSATVTADFRREFHRRHTFHLSDKPIEDDDEQAETHNAGDEEKNADPASSVQRSRSASDAPLPQTEATTTATPAATTPSEAEISQSPQIDQKEKAPEPGVADVPQQQKEDHASSIHEESEISSSQEKVATRDAIPTIDEPKIDEKPERPVDESGDNDKLAEPQTQVLPTREASDENKYQAIPNSSVLSNEPQTIEESIPIPEAPEIEIVHAAEQPEESRPSAGTTIEPEVSETLSDEGNKMGEQNSEEDDENDVIVVSPRSFETLSHSGSFAVIQVGSLGDLSDEIPTPLSARSQEDDSDGGQSTHSNGVSEPSKYMEKTPRWYTRVGRGLTLRAPRFLRRRKVSLENILQSSANEKPVDSTPSRASKRFSIRDYAIHIKELETEDPSQLKTGWLHKKHGIFKSWRELFFVLKKDTIKYFKDQNQKRLAGVVRLDGAEVVECPRKTHLSEYCFSISRRGKEIFVYARSREDYVDWLLSIRDVIRFLQEENVQ